MLQNKEWRMKLRDYIIEHKLTDDSWKGRLAAEGFGLIAAINVTGDSDTRAWYLFQVHSGTDPSVSFFWG